MNEARITITLITGEDLTAKDVTRGPDYVTVYPLGDDKNILFVPWSAIKVMKVGRIF